MGRDERFQKEIASQLGNAGRGLPAIVRDALGRGLAEGDLIALTTQALPQLKLTAIDPVVDPRVPNAEHFLDITLKATLRFRCAKNQTNPEFVRVAEATEFAPVVKPSGASSESAPKPSLKIVRPKEEDVPLPLEGESS